MNKLRLQTYLKVNLAPQSLLSLHSIKAFLQSLALKTFKALPCLALQSLAPSKLPSIKTFKALPCPSNVNVIIQAEPPGQGRHRTRSAGFSRSQLRRTVATLGLSLGGLRSRCGLNRLNASSWSLRNSCCGLGRTSRLQKSNEAISMKPG